VQTSLFDPEPVRPGTETADGARAETTTPAVSSKRDGGHPRDLVIVAERLQDVTEPVERVKLAVEARAMADVVIEDAILETIRSGVTWRQLGAALDVPFQTLHRRYGGAR
jgi:hypothetical protein